MGLCPQFSALWENISVLEHLLLFTRLHGRGAKEGKRLARMWMKRLGIQEYENYRANQLSGGAWVVGGCRSSSHLLASTSTTLKPFLHSSRAVGMGVRSGLR
jgi:hypothetical protein